MVILAIIVGAVLLMNFWTIHNLKDERDYWKNQAITAKSGGRFGRRLEVERDLDRQYHNIKNVKRKEGERVYGR